MHEYRRFNLTVTSQVLPRMVPNVGIGNVKDNVPSGINNIYSLSTSRSVSEGLEMFSATSEQVRECESCRVQRRDVIGAKCGLWLVASDFCGAALRLLWRSPETFPVVSFPIRMPAMSCHACSRRSLNLFFRSIFDLEPVLLPAAKFARHAALPRWFSTARCQSQLEKAFTNNARPLGSKKAPEARDATKIEKERPAWQVEKEAVKRKLNGEAWNPRKKLSPDTMEGIRHLHQTQPTRFTTPILAQHFQVSPEAIKRILKSKWRPSDEEQEDRIRRWDKRGEQIWTNLVELGVKPPKKWREMGVGRAEHGKKPRWKTGSRNAVAVQDSVSGGDFGWAEEDVIPIVDGKSGAPSSRKANMSFSDRMGG